MKRSPLKRNKGLSADPEKVREWMQRSRKPLDPGTPKQRATIPDHTRNRVRSRSGNRCVMCKHLYLEGEIAPIQISAVHHLHHVLPVQTFPEWELEEDNLVGVCAPCHDEHERAHRRIPWAALPSVTRLFAYEAATDGQVDAFLRRTYPGYTPQ